ncbi:MAG TPA: IPT/TIG domain-containing protein [Longimicrobiales bacterium]|nr:IPT/TIG domain-containing protein [Longimicrobiales bacterium]
MHQIPLAHDRRRALLLALLVPLAFVACGDEPSGLDEGYTIRPQSGDQQFGGFGEFLEEPLRVIVEDQSTGDPAAGLTVDWIVIMGNGAVLGPERSTTDANGVASTTLRLGFDDTLYRVRATVTRLVGSAVTFDAYAVAPAQVDSILPVAVDAGDTISVFGSGFATSAQSNTVLIAGFRAPVVEGSATQLRVVVPVCVPSRTAALRVDLGNVAGNTVSLSVTGSEAAPVSMTVGQVLYLGEAETASCLRLSATAGARYLLLLQSAAETGSQELSYRFTGATFDVLSAAEPRALGFGVAGARGTEEVAAAPGSSYVTSTGARAQSALDAALREAERLAVEGRAAPDQRAFRSSAAPDRVEIGDRRDFWVFRSAGDYARVTAEVRHVSDHAILYQDLDAPAGGFGASDFQAFGEVFDDPIYDTMTSVYGATSDVDGNGRVIVLFTPVVNLMTPPGSGSSFVAGFFFGIDLLEGQSRGNDAEIFYTLVPDPDGDFGNVRTLEQILQGVPPVMAHEFQHMIHFNQRVLLRNASIEATWLSEGLAHTAEELIGNVYVARGDDQRAFDFRIQNFLRADAYLGNPSAASPLGPGVSLPVRGASWLLLEYLQEHFGGNALLSALTQTTVSGVANITGQVGLPWGTVLSRWGIALWADDAGVAGLDPSYTFPSLNLRAVYQNTGFPLQPLSLPWGDFSRTATLPAASSAYWLLDAGAAPARLNVAVAGRHAPFGAADRPQLTILRIE